MHYRQYQPCFMEQGHCAGWEIVTVAGYKVREFPLSCQIHKAIKLNLFGTGRIAEEEAGTPRYHILYVSYDYTVLHIRRILAVSFDISCNAWIFHVIHSFLMCCDIATVFGIEKAPNKQG